MFIAGDKVKINLKKLWEGARLSFNDTNKRSTDEGHFVIKDEDTPYEYMIYSPRNGVALAGHLNQLDVIDVGKGSVFLENGIVLSLAEANLCLEMMQKKEFSFIDLFEEISDSVTMDDVKNGELLFQKDKTIDGEEFDVAIYSYQNKNWLIAYKDCECITFREYTGEIPQKEKDAEDSPKKRVVQISVDVEIDADENGDVVAEQIAEELESCGRVVLGSAFQDDMSLEYDYEVEI